MKNNLKKYFMYPKYNIGFHSGWSDKDIDHTGFLHLTKRRICYANKINSKIIISKIETPPPYYLKCEKGQKKGISSGVGSFIFEEKGRYYKIKRSGFKDKGIIPQKFKERAFIINNSKDIKQETYKGPAGLLEFDEAKIEFKVYQEFNKINLHMPQKPVCFYKNCVDKEGVLWGALIFEIKSEFRCDELVMCVIINILHKYFNKNEYEFDYKTPTIFIKCFSVTKLLNILEKGYGKFIYEVGLAIGSNYRKIHDAGYIRGIGNSWYGNDVVCSDGKIGICDLDSSFNKKEIKNKKLLKNLQEIDINSNNAAMYVALYPLKSSFFDIITNILIKGFEKGYITPIYDRVDQKMMNKIIKEYIAIIEKRVLK